MTKCTECKIEIVDNPRGRRRKTCSRKCRDARKHRLYKENRDPLFRDCIQCSKTFEVSQNRMVCSTECREERNRVFRRNHYAKVIANRPQMIEKECSFCNKPLLAPASKPGYVTHDECQAERQKLRNRSKYLKRKEMKESRLSATFLNIGERDNWTCYICEEVVNTNLPRTSRMGGTVDHVVPISRGGDDSLENLRLAHWICNIRKSDSLEFVNAESR